MPSSVRAWRAPRWGRSGQGCKQWHWWHSWGMLRICTVAWYRTWIMSHITASSLCSGVALVWRTCREVASLLVRPAGLIRSNRALKCSQLFRQFDQRILCRSSDFWKSKVSQADFRYWQAWWIYFCRWWGHFYPVLHHWSFRGYWCLLEPFGSEEHPNGGALGFRASPTILINHTKDQGIVAILWKWDGWG